MTPAAVLIVDDEPHVRALFTKLWRNKGYQVHETACGKAAIELVQKRFFDVVIADQALAAGPTGTEILALHRHVSPAGVRVLFTGYASDDLRHICREIDAVYAQKPLVLSELIGQIERLMCQPQKCRSQLANRPASR